MSFSLCFPAETYLPENIGAFDAPEYACAVRLTVYYRVAEEFDYVEMFNKRRSINTEVFFSFYLHPQKGERRTNMFGKKNVCLRFRWLTCWSATLLSNCCTTTCSVREVSPPHTRECEM